jgi:hypothetical protein
MKNLSYLFLIACAILMNGCVHDEAAIFDEPASIRMQKMLKECADILVGSSDGWYADFYPEKDAIIGGYAMYFKFNSNGFVDVSCEIPTNVPAGTTETSQYEFIAERGPILSFSTYNAVMHHFSEPKSTDHNGLQGDYEFVVMKMTQDSITMKGKKYGNRLVFRRNKGNIDPDTYFSQVVGMESDLSEFGMFNFSLNDERIGMVAVLDRTFSIGYKDGEEDKSVSVSYTFTSEGIRLYEPFVFNGVTMQNFSWNRQEEKYVCSDPGINAFFDVFFPDDYELRYKDLIGRWKMQFHGTSTSSWSYADVEIIERKKNVSYEFVAPTILTYPIELSFDAQKGIVSFFAHNAATEEATGYSIRVSPFDRNAGYLYTSVGGPVGIVGVWNHDENDERSIFFEDNERWNTYHANGLYLRRYDGSTSMGSFSDNIGGYRFNDITITKISD